MISDEAVEAAFRSMYGQGPSNPANDGDAHLLKELRLALDAAAPFIAADAWDEGHQEGRVDEWCLTPNPYRRQA